METVTEQSCHWCEELYEAHAARILLYGRALGLSHSEAEDVLQETFVALLQLSTPPDNPHFYLLRSYRNRALNHRRSFWRRLLREVESSRWFEHSDGESPRERAAMRSLAELPPEQREAIVLKVWHQYTFEEIGGLLDLSPNTVAGRYRYGLQKLKSALEDIDYEEAEFVGEGNAPLDTARALTPGASASLCPSH